MISLKYVSFSDTLIQLPATVQLMSLLLDYYKNKQIQRIYVPRQDFFLRNKESSEKVKFIRGVTLTRYILSTYVDSNNA